MYKNMFFFVVFAPYIYYALSLSTELSLRGLKKKCIY